MFYLFILKEHKHGKGREGRREERERERERESQKVSALSVQSLMQGWNSEIHEIVNWAETELDA